MKQNASILFTWEIGQGFGHVLPLIPMAREFKAQGHKVTFALRDVRSVGAMLQGEGFNVLQAPFHPDKFFPAEGPQPQSMADVLTIFGFTSHQHLSGMRAAWEGILQAVRPDLVIASYAPLSLLCARQHGIPTILMAMPFELPIDQHPSPAWRGGELTYSMDGDVINTVNGVFGGAQVSSVHQIFSANKTYVMSFPELDFFGPRLQVNYCGALFVNDVGPSPQWPQGETGTEAKIFTYLNTELPYLDQIRQAIHRSKLRYCVVLRDASPALLDTWRAPNVSITNQIQRLNETLSQCDAVFNFGNLGLVYASLLAGKPMVFYVRNLEAMLTARQVTRLGAGLLPHPPTPENVIQALQAVIDQPQFAANARQFADRHSGYSPVASSKRIFDDALAMLR